MDRAPFTPPWWLRGAHGQTLWAASVRRRPRLRLAWESLPLPDGDCLDLCWTGSGRGSTVLVLHGLEGSIDSPYVRQLLRGLQEGGAGRAVLMHFRGCGGRPNRRARSYHSGETGDLRHVIEVIRERWPGEAVVAAGFSLGGNVLLKYLGERKAGSGLVAAVAVSVPFMLDAAASHLDRGFSRIYRNHLLHRLRSKVVDKFGDAPPPVPAGNTLRLGRLRSFHAFDDTLTAPLHGFEGAGDYYRRCSSRPFLAAITTPTLVIHAADDPFLPRTSLPRPEEVPPAVTLEISRHGGHVGFVAPGRCAPGGDWLTRRIREFLAHHLQ